jgi:hypothetical protein
VNLGLILDKAVGRRLWAAGSGEGRAQAKNLPLWWPSVGAPPMVLFLSAFMFLVLLENYKDIGVRPAQF